MADVYLMLMSQPGQPGQPQGFFTGPTGGDDAIAAATARSAPDSWPPGMTYSVLKFTDVTEVFSATVPMPPPPEP